MDTAGTLTQLRLAYPLLADCALRCLQLLAYFVPHFAHELFIHYKFYAFLAAAYRLSHAIRVNASDLYYLFLLCSLLLFRIALALLIVAMSYISIITFVLDLIIK